jgi:hypothetical protein
MRWLAVVALLLAGCASGGHAAARSGPAAAVPGRPAPLSARVVLPAQTMTAGSSMAGHVLVDNNTGHAVRVSGCGSLFQVVLTRPGYRPTVGWLDCLQQITIPPGHTRYRVTILASYTQCGRGRQRDGLRACLPGGRMPPLPPGTYHARLFQARPLARTPPAITIQVTP